jgi:hypothetical protein
MPIRIAIAFLLALAAGCAGYEGRGLVPGQSTSDDVQAVMGQPSLVRDARDGGKVLWYSRLPYGRQSFAAKIDPAGTLVSIEQRLTLENFARIKPKESSPDDVLDTLGPPYKVYQFPRQQRESWQYPFRTPAFEPYSYYVQFSPDRTLQETFQLFEGGDRPERR